MSMLQVSWSSRSSIFISFLISGWKTKERTPKHETRAKKYPSCRCRTDLSDDDFDARGTLARTNNATRIASWKKSTEAACNSHAWRTGGTSALSASQQPLKAAHAPVHEWPSRHETWVLCQLKRCCLTLLRCCCIWLCHAEIWLLHGTISARPLCLQCLPLHWRCSGIVSGTSPKRRGARGREHATACERGNCPREGSDRATGRGRSSDLRARTRQPPRRPGVGPAFFWRYCTIMLSNHNGTLFPSPRLLSWNV